MKKLLFLIYFLLLPLILLAQENTPSYSQPELSIGGTIGANGSMVFFIPKIKENILFAPMLGAIASFSNNKFSSLIIELNYSQRGWTERFPKGSNLSYSRRLHFLELPVLTSLYYSTSNFRIGLKLGPKIGLLIAENSSKKGTKFTPFQVLRQKIPASHKFAWGLIGGPSLGYSFGKNRIEIDIFAYYGLNDIFPTTIKDPYGKANEIHGTIKLNYLFRIL